MALVMRKNPVDSIQKEAMVALPDLIYFNYMHTTLLQENKLQCFLVHCLRHVPNALIMNKNFVSLYY